MNIPPLPPSITASIAGTDRAAGDRVTVASTSDNSPHYVADNETVDSIDKGSASDDSEADGRQTLDTFERHTPDEDEDREEEKSLDTAPALPPLPPSTNPTTTGARLDFSA